MTDLTFQVNNSKRLKEILSKAAYIKHEVKTLNGDFKDLSDEVTDKDGEFKLTSKTFNTLVNTYLDKGKAQEQVDLLNTCLGFVDDENL